MLKIQGLTSGYGKTPVLKGCNLLAESGKITALIGPNGCGKSTLLKTICGILERKDGQIELDEENIPALTSVQRAQRIAYLSQNRQIPDITVERLVLHGRFPYLSYPRRYGKEDLKAAAEALEKMELSKVADRPLRELSGGQRQRAYIAMALAQDTAVLLLDEPTTYLDVSHQLQLFHHARSLANSGKHVLMVIHDLSQALRFADSVALMADGLVVKQGTPEELFESDLIDQVFGIRLERLETPDGFRYFCEEEMK